MSYQPEEEVTSEIEREIRRLGYSRREFVKLVGALGLSGALAACGSAVKPQTAQGKAAAGTPVPTVASLYSIDDAKGLQWPKSVVPDPSSPVQLSIAHQWDAAFLERQKQFDQLFMQRHPNIKVNAEVTQWTDFLQKYAAQAAGGSLPDLLYCHFSWAQIFITRGLTTGLDSYIAKEPDFNMADFTKPSMGFYQRNGKTYGIAYDCGPRILFYNKDIFDKGGVAYPTSSWTMDDLKQTAIKLTSGSGPNKVFGILDTPNPSDVGMAPPYLEPFGANYVQGNRSVINQPNAVQTMEWWMELRLKYNAVPTPAEVQGMQTDAFTLGRSAMLMGGSWWTPGLNLNAKFKWDVAPWPKGPVTRMTDAEGSGYILTSNSANKDAAWIYLNEYLSSAGQIFMWGMTGRGSPARNSAWPSYLQSKYAPANAKAIQDALNNYATNNILYGPNASKVLNTAGPIWDRVIAKQISVKDGLDQVTQQINPLLASS